MPAFPLFKKWFRLKSLVLLVSLLALILFSGSQPDISDPFISGVMWSSNLGVFCLGGVLLASNRFWLKLFGGLCVPVVVLGVLSEIMPENIAILFASRWMVLLLQSLMLATVVRFSLEGKTSNQTDRLFAGICGYLILGTLWANLYGICQLSGAGYFVTSAGEKATDENGALLYYSFVTMSTLGYGDITATTSFTRILSALEAICGTLYLGIFISTLIPRHMAPPASDSDK